jgi:hypothetical protein
VLSTFQDIIRQAMGGAEKGIFSWLFKTFHGVDVKLAHMLSSEKPITLTAIIQAFDQVLSPKSHAVLHFFYLLKGVLNAFIDIFRGVGQMISTVIGLFSSLPIIGGKNIATWRRLGYALGIFIFTMASGLFVLKTFIGTVKLAKDAYLAFEGALKAFKTVQGLYRAWLWGLGLRVSDTGFKFDKAQTKVYNFANMIKTSFIPTIRTATATMYEWTVSLLTNPVVLLIAAVIALTVGFALLYAKVKVWRDFVQHYWYLIALVPIWGQLILGAAAIDELIKKWHTFVNAIKSGVNWIKSHWYFIPLAQEVGGLVVLIVTLKHVVHWAKEAVKWLHSIHMPGIPGTGGGVSLANVAKGALMGPFGVPYLGAKLFGIPIGQHGGTIMRGGSMMVGDAGPEILHLPRGAVVQPLGAGVGPAISLNVEVLPADVKMDGKQVARIVFSHQSNVNARA